MRTWVGIVAVAGVLLASSVFAQSQPARGSKTTIWKTSAKDTTVVTATGTGLLVINADSDSTLWLFVRGSDGQAKHDTTSVQPESQLELPWDLAKGDTIFSEVTPTEASKFTIMQLLR